MAPGVILAVTLLGSLATTAAADYDPLDLTPGSADANRWRVALTQDPGAATARGLDAQGSIGATLKLLGFGANTLLSEALGVPVEQRGVEPLDLLFGVTAAEAAGPYGETPGLVLGISRARGAVAPGD